MKINIARLEFGVKKILCASVAVLLLVLASCVPIATSVPVESAPVVTVTDKYSEPLAGKTKDALIVVKDWDPVGIIKVKSTEWRIGPKRKSGSRVTYEMLMNEAKKLGAHDVINVRMDVGKEPRGFQGNDELVLYTYTATALAIKYTKAIITDAAVKQAFKEEENRALPPPPPSPAVRPLQVLPPPAER